ncbi:hypothetical protein [Amycolatopsis sp. H20-H5]|uniref:hypothetical protein n=1 Tax=Amycolatopsis sp. H20-H5 TaxID=3046309 RepID=UPI002DBAFC42|nr:hypothetical protein [Amycolatopsis sp. H20-H5]MEC3975902.1 hypothetical protein [Amycolatopsis sp. H20-H5]
MRVGSTHCLARFAFVRTLAAVVAVVVFSLIGSTANASAVAASGLPPWRSCECANPSIDRLQQWLASGEGATVPPTGSLLVRAGGRYAAKVTFLNAEWHVIVVWLGNQFEAQADLSASAGFWLTYSATDDLYVQLRPASHWSGGDKWLTLVPSTGGKLVKRFFSFSPAKWTALPELGTPPYSFASALREARGLVFVGKTPNRLDFRGLRVDGYRPPCL